MGKLDGEILAESILEKEQRARNCFAKIQEILKEYNCVMEPMVQISSKGVQMESRVIAQDELFQGIFPRG